MIIYILFSASLLFHACRPLLPIDSYSFFQLVTSPPLFSISLLIIISIFSSTTVAITILLSASRFILVLFLPVFTLPPLVFSLILVLILLTSLFLIFPILDPILSSAAHRVFITDYYHHHFSIVHLMVSTTEPCHWTQVCYFHCHHEWLLSCLFTPV